MVITEQLCKINTKCKNFYTHQQQQFLEVQQTLTPQYHGKHKPDGNFSYSHQ